MLNLLVGTIKKGNNFVTPLCKEIYDLLTSVMLHQGIVKCSNYCKFIIHDMKLIEF